jgi:hypothetical protein
MLLSFNPAEEENPLDPVSKTHSPPGSRLTEGVWESALSGLPILWMLTEAVIKGQERIRENRVMVQALIFDEAENGLLCCSRKIYQAWGIP